MDIVNHSLCDRLLDAPDDMPEPVCEKLPVREFSDQHGNWSISFWQPSADELAILNGGGTIALWVREQGDNHPVVGMGVQEKEQ